MRGVGGPDLGVVSAQGEAGHQVVHLRVSRVRRQRIVQTLSTSLLSIVLETEHTSQSALGIVLETEHTSQSALGIVLETEHTSQSALGIVLETEHTSQSALLCVVLETEHTSQSALLSIVRETEHSSQSASSAADDYQRSARQGRQRHNNSISENDNVSAWSFCYHCYFYKLF